MIEGIAAAAEKVGALIAEATEKSAEVLAEGTKEAGKIVEQSISTIEIKGKPIDSSEGKPNMDIVRNRSLEYILIENGDFPFQQHEDVPIELPIEEMPELPQPDDIPNRFPIEEMPKLPPIAVLSPELPTDIEVPFEKLIEPDADLGEVGAKVEESEAVEADEKVGLSDEEKALIKDETGWSDEIIDHIESMDQYEIYKNADLHEAEVNGRKCLLKDIDMDYVDPKTGMTNRELMEKGRSPIDSKTGEKIELHHMGQDPNGPFAELCENSEHGDGNHGILHTRFEDSWRNNSELNNQYQTEKRNHWKARAQEV